MEIVGQNPNARIQGELFFPSIPSDWGVLVLGGSSGQLDTYTAQLFADTGAIAFAQRWFGRSGLPSEIRDVPLELFIEGIQLLQAKGCSRIAILGRSRGAEAALLIAENCAHVQAVFAISPSSVAWAGTGMDGAPSWTFRDSAIPFVPYDLSWWNEPRMGLVEYREYHQRSLRLDPQATARATIRVERMQAELVLVAGGADTLWPSDEFANSIAQRLSAHGRTSTVLIHPDAGHRILLPGEKTPRSTRHAHGGDDAADAELGSVAWETIVKHMRTAPSP